MLLHSIRMSSWIELDIQQNINRILFWSSKMQNNSSFLKCYSPLFLTPRSVDHKTLALWPLSWMSPCWFRQYFAGHWPRVGTREQLLGKGTTRKRPVRELNPDFHVSRTQRAASILEYCLFVWPRAAMVCYLHQMHRNTSFNKMIMLISLAFYLCTTYVLSVI